MKKELLDFIVCPQTGDKLELEDGELFTNNTSYPLFNNIPWLFANPEFAFLEWSTKIQKFIDEEQSYIGFLRLLVESEKNKLTQTRYEKLIEAKSHNINVFKEYLRVFLNQKTINLLPSNQQIFSYFQLIFRDWCWDSQELDSYLSFINEHIKTPSKILVLGAGSCGLSAKIAEQHSDSTIISVDHNPFLLMIAQDIMDKKELSLFDYSLFPKNLASTTHKWHIDKKTDYPNHHIINCSFPKLPFNEECFDFIICPWFLDILESPISQSLNDLNKFLIPSGEVLYIGPANIHHQDISDQLCSEEIIDTFKDFYNDVSFEQKSVSYLANPLNSQNRIEEILFVGSKNKKEVLLKKQEQQFDIKFTPALEQLKASTQITHEILNLIDKNMSFSQLAKKLENKFSLSPQEAEFYAESFIKKINQEL